MENDKAILHKNKKSLDPALPLKNKRKELFCQLYALEFWGKPVEALLGANYNVPETDAAKRAKEILTAENVQQRIKFLRKTQAELSIADNVWIQECLINIIHNAKRDSDRIRALASLNKLMNVKPVSKTQQQNLNIRMEQLSLPLFEGEAEGFDEEVDYAKPLF